MRVDLEELEEHLLLERGGRDVDHVLTNSRIVRLDLVVDPLDSFEDGGLVECTIEHYDRGRLLVDLQHGNELQA